MLALILSVVPASIYAQLPTVDEHFPMATPESQGLSSEALNSLADIISGYLEKDMIVGAELLIIKNRHTVLHKTFGMRDREDKLAWGKDTICNIRSMTKTLTGAAAQILIDQGKLAPDDPVAKYLPGFQNEKSRGITVKQLLTHRSGLPLTMITEAIDQYENLLAIGNAAGENGPEFEPDSKFWYSDAGADTLGAVVEVASGMLLDDFITKELLEPLGMNDSFYVGDVEDLRFPRIASLYIGTSGAWTRYWTPANKITLYPFAWGSQTLYSTPNDYAKFLAMWMDNGKAADKQILSEAAIKRTLTPASEMSMLGSDERFPTDFTDLEVYYGQMSVLHVPKENPTGSKPVIIGHSGSDGTIAWAWPEQDLMILYFTQSRGGSSALRLEEPIDQLILHPDRIKVVEEVPEKYKQFVGKYIANFAAFINEEFEVKVRNGKLVLDIPSQMVFELLDPDDEGKRQFAITNTISVSFGRDENGNVNLLKLHQGDVIFEVPKKGTKLAEEMAKLPTVDPEKVKKYIGKYKDTNTGGEIEVYMLETENVLCVKAQQAGGGIVFHLRQTDELHKWQVKQMPMIFLTFEFDKNGENVISMTRHAGGQSFTMPRIVEKPDDIDQEEKEKEKVEEN